MRSFITVVTAFLLLGGAIAIASFTQSSPEAVSPSPAPIVFQENNSASRLELLVAAVTGAGQTRFFSCQKDTCETKPGIPSANQEAAVTLQAAFFYKDDELVRVKSEQSQTETLVEKTPLVAPRGLFLSPDGGKLAYFLDNTHDETKELTELWYVDTATSERHLVAENLTRPDILTTPRWNSSSSHLWFIADSGSKNEKKIEFVVVAVSPAAVAARFTSFDWERFSEAESDSVLDVSFTGRSLAVAEPASAYRTDLTLIHDGSAPQTSTVRGHVPFLQWLEDGRLVYAVQDDSGFSMWNVRSIVHTFTARLPGQFSAAKADSEREFIAFIHKADGKFRWSAFQPATSLVFEQGEVAGISENPTIIRVEQREAGAEAAPPAASLSALLEDAEITAFIEQNLVAITDQTTAKAVRVITTGQPNVVYLDFRNSSGADHRLLLTIRDAIHPEWSIRARYEPAGGEWRRTQGGGVSDPVPKNVYEWEASLNQWILKSSTK